MPLRALCCAMGDARRPSSRDLYIARAVRTVLAGVLGLQWPWPDRGPALHFSRLMPPPRARAHVDRVVCARGHSPHPHSHTPPRLASSAAKASRV
eukprot:2692556-Rhodomonas_salina.1